MSVDTPQKNVEVIDFGPVNGTVDERGAFQLELGTLELRHRGQRIDLRPQAVHLLALLLHRDGQLVTTAELRLALWGTQELAWRNSLHQCMRDLRRALSDDARNPRFVATVARRGYRFVGERSPSPSIETPADTTTPLRRLARAARRPSVAFAAGVATALLLPATYFMLCVILSN